MSLNLDARQRAMLQEMGVTVWTRTETATPQSPAAPPPAAAAVHPNSKPSWGYLTGKQPIQFADEVLARAGREDPLRATGLHAA